MMNGPFHSHSVAEKLLSSLPVKEPHFLNYESQPSTAWDLLLALCWGRATPTNTWKAVLYREKSQGHARQVP